MPKHSRLAEQRAALQWYMRREARDAPPVFVGRANVVRDIETTAETALAAWREGDEFPGLTRVVQGAPGAGKSSLLAHLRRQWDAALTTGDKNAPIAVNVALEALTDADQMAAALRRGLPQLPGQSWVPVVTGALMSLVAPGRLADVASGTARALFERRVFGRPVVLMIDEAQDARPFQKEAGVLRMLHQGHASDIPMLPVLAGLGHLREHLQQPGIGLSRFSDERHSVHTLGVISDDEVRELFDGWLQHFHVTAEDDEAARWSDALIHDSQGWPMHTNHFLTSLASQLLMPHRDPRQLASADLQTVRLDAAKRRSAYYATRYDNPLLDECGREVGEAMAGLQSTGRARLRDVLDTIQKVFRYENREDARRAFSILRERGFLQLVDGSNPLGDVDTRRFYACPIPSLASHAAACESLAHMVAATGDAEGIARMVHNEPGAIAARDAMGRVPLHLAAECRWAEVAGTLLAAGADPDATDAVGKTPRTLWPEFDWPAPQSA